MPKVADRPAKSGTRKLSEVTRHLVKPSGIVRTGWPAVERTCRQKLGIRFDRWQDGAGRLILAETEDGSLASTVGGVGISIPRQVGKTYLLAGLIFGLCINRPGLLVIWSAHHAKTHGETFIAMQEFAKRTRVEPYIRQVYTGSGDEEVRFLNGSRILFGARERGFGRGIPGVDVLVMDEAQILSERAMDAMLATLNTSNLGLHLYVGTPPRPEDNSEMFTTMRRECLSGESDDTVWIECGADPDYKPTPAPAPLKDRDLVQIAKANPSYPHRTPLKSILRMRKKLTLDSYMREALGIWDEDDTSDVFDGHWPRCKVDPPPDAPLEWLGIAVSVDLKSAGIIGGGVVDGVPLVKPLAHGRGMEWIVAEMDRWPEVPVVIDGRGPGAVLLPALRTVLGRRLHEATTENVKDACAGVWQRVTTGEFMHPGVKQLDDAVSVAVQRPVGDRWAWGRRKSTGDICLLEGATLVTWALDTLTATYEVLDSIC